MADEFERPRTRLSFTHERLEHRIANPLHEKASHLRGAFERKRDPLHAAELDAQGRSEAERRRDAAERETWRTARIAELAQQRSQLQAVRNRSDEIARDLAKARTTPDRQTVLREAFKAHRRLAHEATPLLRRDIFDR